MRIKVIFRLLAILVLGLAVAGCNVKVDMPLLPNIGATGKSTTQLTQESKDETKNGGKKVLMNLDIDQNLASDIGLSRDKNCVQVVELADSSVAVDFASQACGSDLVPVSADSIAFTASYEKTDTDIYQVKMDSSAIGYFVIDGSSATLKQLCNDTFKTVCLPSISSGSISGKPIMLN